MGLAVDSVSKGFSCLLKPHELTSGMSYYTQADSKKSENDPILPKVIKLKKEILRKCLTLR